MLESYGYSSWASQQRRRWGDASLGESRLRSLYLEGGQRNAKKTAQKKGEAESLENTRNSSRGELGRRSGGDQAEGRAQTGEVKTGSRSSGEITWTTLETRQLRGGPGRRRTAAYKKGGLYELAAITDFRDGRKGAGAAGRREGGPNSFDGNQVSLFGAKSR